MFFGRKAIRDVAESITSKDVQQTQRLASGVVSKVLQPFGNPHRRTGTDWVGDPLDHDFSMTRENDVHLSGIMPMATRWRLRTNRHLSDPYGYLISRRQIPTDQFPPAHCAFRRTRPFLSGTIPEVAEHGGSGVGHVQTVPVSHEPVPICIRYRAKG